MTLQRLIFTTVSCLLLLSACDGGGPAPGPAAPPAAAGRDTLLVSGRTTKGPVAGARIELYAVDARGRAAGPAVATTQSDDRGDWSVSVPADHAGLLVRSSGGVFVDEADPDLSNPRRIELAPDETLLSYLPPGERQASITLVSHALVRKSMLETDADNFQARLASNRARYRELLQLDPLVTTAADPLAPQGSADQQRYALVAGGLAYALNALAVAGGQSVADFATIEGLLADLLDCRLDGTGLGGQFLYDVAALSGRTLSDEILRFRNNHASDYAGVALPQLDAAGCPAAADALDLEPPRFVVPPAPLTLAAADAGGSAPDEPAVAAALAQVVVEDNRDPAVGLRVSLPSRFALGTTEVLVSAVDGWGNAGRVLWPVTVTDQTPPVLTPPADQLVDAVAARTPVALGTPLATDNVSTSLVISNDAPAGGFPVGDTTVTWRAEDAAGLVAEALQRVTVIGATPVVSAGFQPPPLSVGAAVDLDLALFFTDPFAATLTYTLAGLPAGTGLVFEPETGRLSGNPTSADRAASPLLLTLGASNGQFDQSVSFELPVAPRIPDFALSASQIQVDEDFVSAPVIEIEPLVPIPPAILNISVDVTPPVADVAVVADEAIVLRARPDDNGAATVTVTAQNLLTGEQASQSVLLEVAPVNDAPLPVAPSMVREVLVGSPLALDLGASFVDVDGDPMTFAADGLPRALSLTVDGQLVGQLAEADVHAGRYPLTLRADDGNGPGAELALALEPRLADADGDGLSDAREAILGTDALAADTDGDGVDDGTEVLAASDPLTPAAHVLFVSADGNNANDGRTPRSALRDLDGLANLPPGESAARPTFVVFAAAAEPYDGALELSANCRHTVLVGDRAGASTLRSTRARALSFENCQAMQVMRLTMAGNPFGAIRARNGSLRLHDVALLANASATDGAGLSAHNVLLDVDGLVASNNVSAGRGGALATDGGSVAIANAQFHGNRAALAGGAVAVRRPRARAQVVNALFVGNVAPTGAALVAALPGQVQARFVTATDHRLGAGGAAFAAENGASIELLDCVLADNRAPDGTPGTLGPVVTTDYCSLDSAPVGPNDSRLAGADVAFGPAYTLRAASGALDNGSLTAVAAGLFEAFSVSGSVDPDLGTVDRGFHYRVRPQWSGQGDVQLRAGAGDDLLPPDGLAAVVVRPVQRSGELGPGYRVRFAVDGADLETAVDVGDGRYAAFVPQGTAPERVSWFLVDRVLAPE